MKKINNKKILINSSSALLAFILFIIFILLTIAVSSYVLLLKRPIIKNENFLNNYSMDVYEDICSKTYDKTIPTNLPSTVSFQIFDEKKIKKDIRKYIYASLAGEKYDFDTYSFESTLDSNIKKYLDESNIKLNDKQKKNVNEYKSQICSIYKKCIKISYLEYYVNHKDMVNKIYYIFVISCIVLSMIIMGALLLIQKWVVSFAKYVFYSVLATALVSVIVPSILLYKKINLSLVVDPYYYYYLIEKSLDRVIRGFLYIGLIWSISVIMMMLMISQLKLRKYSIRHKISRKVYENYNKRRNNREEDNESIIIMGE